MSVMPESHLRAGRALKVKRDRTVLARSFGPRFDRHSGEARWLASIGTRVRDALVDVEAIPRNLPPKLYCDALMVDQAGGFLLVDAEAPRSAQIGFAPARAVQNIALWDAWMAADPTAMARVPPSGSLGCTFLLATESSVSDALIKRLQQARTALATAGLLDPTRFRGELTPASATSK